jgi:TldD protein
MADFHKLSHLVLNEVRRKGASYADVRMVRTEDENLTLTNAVPELIEKSYDFGFGVRVIAEGAWGFASSADLNDKEIVRISRLAVEIAKASARLKKRPVELSPIGRITGSYKTPFEVDPFAIPLKEKIEYLAHLCNLMSKQQGIATTEANMSFRRMWQYFASSEDSRIEQEILQTGAGIYCSAAVGHAARAKRSYPGSSGQYECRGYELIPELKFEENAPVIAAQAVALLSAKECPSGIKDIVLDGSHLSLQIHESIGHALELDRVFGSERDFSGVSFATVDKLDNFQFASEIVNVTTDATTPFGLGTFGYDDEGVPAQKVDLIKNGALVGYLSSRETAARIGRKSSGAARADGWGNVPIVRMTNTNLLPGDLTLEELISEIDDGIYMETTASWSIDNYRESFQMGCEIGWEIKNGKLGEMIKDPTYSGTTVNFWNSCDGIANKDFWRVWGTPNCGKGQPAQNARVGQGAAPARFRQVKVGA